ncbi:MAG: class I SAM-dependent methyltransferase [Halobacteriaceae archaeon]
MMADYLRLLSKAVKNPGKVPPFLHQRLFQPDNRKIEDGIVTWNTFDWGDGDTPAQIAAINYHMVQALRDDLEGESIYHAVEIGSGYGRVTPWLTEFAKQVTGVEPNDEMRNLADQYYPDIRFIDAKAQNIPFDTDGVDFVFTRSVLQHISEDDLKKACSEIARIAEPEAKILLCEATEGEENSGIYHPRTPKEYEELLSPFELQNVWKRETPAKTREHNRERMMFAQS